MRTPKGMTAPKEMDGEPLAGSYRSHQVPIEDPKTNPAHLQLLEQWMRSYHVEELFDEQGSPKPEIHGYPSAVQSLLFGREVLGRFQINGYHEEGTTTTPFQRKTPEWASPPIIQKR